VQRIKPGCTDQTRSNRDCSVILAFLILLLCNTPQAEEVKVQRNACCCFFSISWNPLSMAINGAFTMN